MTRSTSTHPVLPPLPHAGPRRASARSEQHRPRRPTRPSSTVRWQTRRVPAMPSSTGSASADRRIRSPPSRSPTPWSLSTACDSRISKPQRLASQGLPTEPYHRRSEPALLLPADPALSRRTRSSRGERLGNRHPLRLHRANCGAGHGVGDPGAVRERHHSYHDNPHLSHARPPQ